MSDIVYVLGVCGKSCYMLGCVCVVSGTLLTSYAQR